MEQGAGVPGQAEQPARRRSRKTPGDSQALSTQGRRLPELPVDARRRRHCTVPRRFPPPFIYPPTSMWGAACAWQVVRTLSGSATSICMGNSKNRLPTQKSSQGHARLSWTRARSHELTKSAQPRREGRQGPPRPGPGACRVGRFGELPYTCTCRVGRFGQLPYTYNCRVAYQT